MCMHIRTHPCMHAHTHTCTCVRTCTHTHIFCPPPSLSHPPPSPFCCLYVSTTFTFVGILVHLLQSQQFLQAVIFQDQSSGWGTLLPQRLQQGQTLSQTCHPLLLHLQDELHIFLSIYVPIHWALQKRSLCIVLVAQSLHNILMGHSNNSPCGQVLTMLMGSCLHHMTHLMQSGQLLLPGIDRLATQSQAIAPILSSQLLP